jgi:hypothetical protein
MSTGPAERPSLDGDTVLVPAPDIVEAPVADEVILWHRDRAVPLQLNPVATAIWWHFESAPLDQVTHDVAQYYRQPVERVTDSVRFVTRSLYRAGLLRNAADPLAPLPPQSAPASEVVEHRPSAQIGTTAANWLRRRAVHRISVRVGRVRFAVSSNTAALDARVVALLGSMIDDGDAAALRYLLVDAGDTGRGRRYWLLSDTGLPLECTDSVDDLVERLALHVAELAAVQRGAGVPLRLGVLEAHDHAVAVQWDLLASRPVLEPQLDHLGYRIRSGQWALIDPSDLSVRPGAAFGDEGRSVDDPAGLALRGIVGWFGAGSLAIPNTHAEWAWTVAMFGCASTDPVPTDRQTLLETSVTLAETCRVVALSDAGPSALLHALSEISKLDP